MLVELFSEELCLFAFALRAAAAQSGQGAKIVKSSSDEDDA